MTGLLAIALYEILLIESCHLCFQLVNTNDVVLSQFGLVQSGLIALYKQAFISEYEIVPTVSAF